MDFPTWFSAGSYGGLAVCLLTAAAIASYTLRLHRGTRRQLARATLVCLLCCCLMFAPIAWGQTRFDLLGPTLPSGEIAFWLAWTALIGWSVPLGLALGYLALAVPQPATGAVPVPPGVRGPVIVSHPAALDDPGRLIEPFGTGQAWGYLVPTGGLFADRSLALTQQVTILGREPDCDIVVPDQQASRHHAELRWDHGHIALVDRGSLNGTRLNGQRVWGQVPLREGDVIQIGAHHYRVDLAASTGNGQTTAAAADADSEDTRKVPNAAKGSTSSPVLGRAIVLVAEDGPKAGTRWELGGPISSIGRDASCDVSVPDSSVSRRHAQVIRQASGIYVQDLDSQNGTRLNGEVLSAPAPLHEGDVLQVGEVNLRCVFATTPRPTSASADAVATADSGAPTTSAAPVRRAVLNTHTLMAPLTRPADRPHLAPPRLLPSPDLTTPPDPA